MNKELIKTYKAEFDHWLNGGELLFKPDGKQTWFDTLRTEIDWSVKGMYIINDTYVQLRIALAEGKIIQYNPLLASTNRWDDIKKFKPTKDCTVANYRVKPKPSFKVGDFITVTGTGVSTEQVVEIDGDTIHVRNYGTCHVNQATPWQPKKGDWCWFWDENFKTPLLFQFKGLSLSSYYKYNAINGLDYMYCEPFIGTLPTKLQQGTK